MLGQTKREREALAPWFVGWRELDGDLGMRHGHPIQIDALAIHDGFDQVEDGVGIIRRGLGRKGDRAMAAIG